ncbi:MAG: hypothetical protein WC119_01970 [Synergistaceae bacterium]
MDISIKCRVSLSKKLRSILGDSEGRVVLVADPVRNGVGEASLIISGDNLDINGVRQSLEKETSIQFTPLSFENNVPSESTVSNIFSSGGNVRQGPRTVVDRLAATVPPEKGEVAHAIKSAEEITTPPEFKEYQDPKFKSFVYSIEELMMAVKAAQGKESEIDLNAIENPRQRAIAMEMKEQAEAIDIPAYVVNDTCGSVRLNDIDLSLDLNIPVNLSNISAKRVGSSADLKAMLRQKIVKFIKPDEVESYRQKAIHGTQSMGLETYSTRDEAENAIGSTEKIPKAESMYVGVEDDSPSEQEQLAGLINLTPMGESNGARTSFHGGGQPRARKTIGSGSQINPKGIKTISKI